MTYLGQCVPPDATTCPECGSRRLWVSRAPNDERRYHVTGMTCEACGLEARADASGNVAVTKRGDLTTACQTGGQDE